MKAVHRQWLRALTSLPTAPGQEHRVVAWLKHWVRDRPLLTLSADRFGNLTIALRPDVVGPTPHPVIFTAHLDHPAFVVRSVDGPRQLTAEFRGSVREPFFQGAHITLHHGDQTPQPGRIESVTPPGQDGPDRVLVMRFERDLVAEPGDVMRWDTGETRQADGLLYAPACDDLAGVAAALSALDLVAGREERPLPDVRVLLTRAEEVGFVGAIAAAREKLIPERAMLVNIENSKADPHYAPIGGGPVLRVGDRSTTFDPDMTFRLGKLASRLTEQDEGFRYQRKLMDGGVCEASAFVAYGYQVGAVCLPLGNYHNMDEAAALIGPEYISLADYDALIRLLAAAAHGLPDPELAPSLHSRLEDIYQRRGYLLTDA